MKKRANNVLVVINLFSSAENFVGGQFRYLTEHGYNMHLICSPDERIESFAKSQGISYKAIPLNRQLSPAQDFRSLIQICDYIRTNQIDTVIGHQAKGRLLSTLASLIMRVPNVIIFAHGAIFETSTGLKRWLLLMESRLESILSDKVVCVSTYIRNLRLKYRIDKQKKQVILGAGTCGGIDTITRFNRSNRSYDSIRTLKSKYNIKPDDFVVGFVGRLVRDKGVAELTKAFELLKKRNPQKSLKLMVVGPQEQRDGLPEDILGILKHSPDIIYTGRVSLDDMPLQYCCMDCLVLPSHREGFGFCNIEAQAMGIPVLTSHITGCRDSIVDGFTGLYIDLHPEDIAKKIESLFDEKLRNELGKNGRCWVTENFDHTVIWPFVKQLLDNINL